MPEITVGEEANGRLIGVAVGDTLRIALPEDPMAGLRWQIEPSSLSAVSAVRLQSVGLQMEGGEAGGGLRLFRFSAEGRGQVTVRLELMRDWDGGQAHAAFAIAIDIR